MSQLSVAEVVAHEVKDAYESGDPRRIAVAEEIERSGFVRTRFTDTPDHETQVEPAVLARADDLLAMELGQVLASQNALGKIDEGLSSLN